MSTWDAELELAHAASDRGDTAAAIAAYERLLAREGIDNSRRAEVLAFLSVERGCGACQGGAGPVAPRRVVTAIAFYS
jgi:hypothetical protein